MSFCSITGPFEEEGITVYLRVHCNAATQSEEHTGNQEKVEFLLFLVPELAASLGF